MAEILTPSLRESSHSESIVPTPQPSVELPPAPAAATPLEASFASEAINMLPTFVSPKHSTKTNEGDVPFVSALPTQNSWHTVGNKCDDQTSNASDGKAQWKSAPEASSVGVGVNEPVQNSKQEESLAASLEALTNLYLKEVLSADELAAAKAKLLGTELPKKKPVSIPDQLLNDNIVDQTEFKSLVTLSTHTIPVCNAIRSVHQSWAATRYFTPQDFSSVKQVLIAQSAKADSLLAAVSSFLEYYASGEFATLGFTNNQFISLKRSALGGDTTVLDGLKKLGQLMRKLASRPEFSLSEKIREMMANGDHLIAGELLSLFEIVESGSIMPSDYNEAQNTMVGERQGAGRKLSDDICSVFGLFKRGIISKDEFTATKNRLLRISEPGDSWFTAPAPDANEQLVPTPFQSEGARSKASKKKKRSGSTRPPSYMGVPRNLYPIVPPVSPEYVDPGIGAASAFDRAASYRSHGAEQFPGELLNGHIIETGSSTGKQALAATTTTIPSEKESTLTWATANGTEMYSVPSTDVMHTPEEGDLDPKKIIRPSDINNILSPWNALGQAINRRFIQNDDAQSTCSTSLPTTPCLPEPLTFRDRLITFFHCYRPSKLPSVEPTVRNGDEKQVMDLLIQKYGPEPTSNIMVLPLAKGWTQCESTAGDIFYIHENGQKEWVRPVCGFK
eukprot:TRINITY_DN5616_c0_g1_i1.p1 TRINITY_DN5616_c0_g1~~TRINITY_DN5616_c0_g1_i1.p1  ORF type:complete len:676 (+),score=130.89 TRINITY_DN5616_c0_g1_i1:886-2913(+)